MTAWNYNFAKTDPARREFFRKEKLGRKVRFEVISESREKLLQELANRPRFGEPPLPCFSYQFRSFLNRGNFEKVQSFHAVKRWMTLEPIDQEIPEGHVPMYFWFEGEWKLLPSVHHLDNMIEED